VHALTETLAVEVAQFGVRVLLVEPGAFRTGIYGQAWDARNHLAEYDALRAMSTARFAAVSGTEKGDPAKAMEAVVDVVRGEGAANGRAFPGRLVLGEDAEQDVRAKCKKVLDYLNEWKDVVRDVNFSQLDL
jgi:NAD(P)-dependent dehydrogenase (short-subunit alcohol dehydrogenase family)